MKGARARGMRAGLIAAIMVAALCAAAGADDTPAADQPVGNIVEMTLSGQLTERPDPYAGLFGRTSLSLRQVADALDRARTDERTVAVVLKLRGAGLTFTQVQALRDRVARVRKAGKKVFCSLISAGQGEYLLAASCDRAAVVPAGGLNLVGLRADVYFLKGLLDKIGVQADLLQVGRFKGAAENLTRTGMSPELRRMLTGVLDETYERMVADIAAGRGMPAAKVRALIDAGPYTADKALKAGLVDWVVYADEFDARIKAEMKRPTRFVKESFGRQTFAAGNLENPLALFGTIMRMMNPTPPTPSGKPRVAVVYVTGTIVVGNAQTGLFGSQQAASTPICRALMQARQDESIKAVVLRVNSPGGSALASDLIWHEVGRCARAKPVIVSMGDVAASGGYYVSASATAIVAQPGTITGSIGVVGGKIVLGGLYGKIGVTKETITRGRRVGLLDETTPFSADERRVVSALMKDIYDGFVSKVAAGRNMKREAVEAVAEGRIWTGASAKRVGLVDELGGLPAALALAKTKAGLAADADVEIVPLPEQKGLLEQMLGGASAFAPNAAGAGGAAPAVLTHVAPREMGRLADGLAVGDVLRRERVAVAAPVLPEVR